MKNYHVTMVDPRQIVSKRLRGCRTAQTVQSFAQKYKVPYVWYRPQNGQKMMLVDWPAFRATWKQYWSEFKTTSSPWSRTSAWSNTTQKTKYTASGTKPRRTTRTTSKRTAAQPPRFQTRSTRSSSSTTRRMRRAA